MKQGKRHRKRARGIACFKKKAAEKLRQTGKIRFLVGRTGKKSRKVKWGAV